MGQCGSNIIVKRDISHNKPTYRILCNKEGLILNVTDPLLERLKYNFETLNSQFIGILMSEFMSMLHQKYYIPMFNRIEGIERNRIENKLKNLHHKRSLIIYDIDRKAHYVRVSIERLTLDSPMIDNEAEFHNPMRDSDFLIQFHFINETEKLFYTQTPMEASKIFKLNKTNSVIIMIDFVHSTELLHEKGAVSLIDVSIRFHAAITDLIRNKYYPFIYLHETVGDSFVMALNTDWTYNTEQFCASLAVNFAFDLIQATREFIKVRTGIGYGKIHYGTIGSSFSFFGFPMNIAARLENKCKENEINICKALYDKLCGELLTLKMDSYKDIIVKQKDTLKGFGDTEYYSIPVYQNEPFLVYS